MERSVALVADRDPAVRAAIRDVLEQRKVLTLGAESTGEAIDALGTRTIDLLFVDLDPGSTDMRVVLRHSRQLSPAPVALGLIDQASEADEQPSTEPGLFDLVHKPLVGERLRFAVERALAQLKLLAEMRRLRERLQARQGFHGLVGRSAAMERVRDQLEQLAPTDLSLWFFGEDGTGKQLAARTLHSSSPRAGAAFVVVDCESLSAEEWQRQWSADGDAGPAGTSVVSQAGGGTLYLDRITSLDATRQEQLLTAIRGWPRPDGGPSAGLQSVPRVLAGSQEDPVVASEQGSLLEPLLERLTDGTVRMPALRDRTEDIGMLARHFVGAIREINQLPPIAVSAEALRLLERYHWPANVRELRNAVEHAVILTTEGKIRPQDLPDKIREEQPTAPASARYPASYRFRDAKRAVVDSFEHSYLSNLLERYGGNVTSASQHAGMLRSALQRLLRKHGLRSAEYRTARAATRQPEQAEPGSE